LVSFPKQAKKITEKLHWMRQKGDFGAGFMPPEAPLQKGYIAS
jgi:hypothetical protein